MRSSQFISGKMPGGSLFCIRIRTPQNTNKAMVPSVALKSLVIMNIVEYEAYNLCK